MLILPGRSASWSAATGWIEQFSDDFSAVTDVDLGTTSDWDEYKPGGGALRLRDTDKVRTQLGTAKNYGFYVGSMGNDQRARVEIDVFTSTGTTGISACARFDGTSTFYEARYIRNSAGASYDLELFEWTAGSEASLGSNTGIGSTGKFVDIECVGTLITGTVYAADGTTVVSTLGITDASIASGRVGMGIVTLSATVTSCQIDNFFGYDQ